jgi:hypothetical protein
MPAGKLTTISHRRWLDLKENWEKMKAKVDIISGGDTPFTRPDCLDPCD